MAKNAAAAKKEPKPKVENHPLWKYLRSGDFEKAEYASIRGGAVNSRDDTFGWTPLLFAANAGANELMTVLFNREVNIEVACKEGNRALTLAARGGHVAATELLIHRKADLNAQNVHGWTPLMYAAMSGAVEVSKALLWADADVTRVDLQRRNVCMWAARHGHQGIMEALLAKGVDLTLHDAEGFTALDHANEHLELKATLVLAEERNRRILEAVQRNDEVAVLEAIADGANCDAQDGQGWTPLMWAVLHDSAELAGILVQHGAHAALLGEDAELGGQLAAHHLEVSSRVQEVLRANRLLVAAAAVLDWTTASEQLQVGAYVDALDYERQTPLILAGKQGSVNGVELLVSRSAAVNLRDATGNTSALWAAASGHLEVVSLLHKNQADLSIRSFEGDSALHMAVRSNNGCMLQVLLAAKADIEECDYNHNTPLHLAASLGSCMALSTLLFCGADSSATDRDGRTALAIAVACERTAACEVMLSPLEVPAAFPVPEVKPEPVQAPPPKTRPPSKESRNKSQRPASGATAGSQGSRNTAGSKNSKNSKASRRPPSSGSAPIIIKRSLKDSKGTIISGAGTNADTAASGSITGGGGTLQRQRSGSLSSQPLGTTLELEQFVEAEATDVEAEGTVDENSQGEVEINEVEMDEDEAQKLADELESRYTGLMRTAYRWRRDLINEPPEIATPQELLGAVDPDGRSVVHLAVDTRNLAHLRSLLFMKANIDAADPRGRSPLMDAAEAGHRDVVEELLELHPDVEAEDREGKKAFDLTSDPAIKELLARELVRRKLPKNQRAVAASSAAKTFANTGAGVFRLRFEELPVKVSEEVLVEELKDLLRAQGTGKPANLEVVCDPITDRPRGFAYVDFTHPRAAEVALQCDGEEVLSKIIRVVRDDPSEYN